MKNILKLVIIMMLIIAIAVSVGMLANKVITEEIPFPYKNAAERNHAKVIPLIDKINNVRSSNQTGIQIINYDPNYRVQPENRYACENKFNSQLLIDSIKLILTESDCDQEYIGYEVGYTKNSDNYFIDKNSTYSKGVLQNQMGNILIDPSILYELFYQPAYHTIDPTNQYIYDTTNSKYALSISNRMVGNKESYELVINRNNTEDIKTWDFTKYQKEAVTELWDFTNKGKIIGSLSKGENISFRLEFIDL